MFLKRLEVVGFKSFAERIGIDFVPGVTAVVGPNGSGKSNVTDAIRWVLGEQSAKSLRGSKMEDVIFAGSESRKPLNFAEVALILDNTDERIPIPYTEISVTRRVYRSGDSEYLLNNQHCRLKDITDLFMDSGLGKEAFSIISQGRVDSILNSRPDDRRLIFEEAAGVLKYKQRKKKAELKLAETEENLHRVLDILHELDNRLEPLQIQASAAKDYVRMKSELKDFDISLIVHDLTACEAQLKALQDELADLEANELLHAGEMTMLEKSLRQVRAELKTLDSHLDTSQENLVEATAEVERWDGRKALMHEKRSNAEKHLKQLEAQFVVSQQEAKKQALNKSEKMVLFAEKQKEVSSLRQAIKQLEQALTRSASEIEEEIDVYKHQYIDLLNEEATIKNELKHINQQLQQQQETAERMTDRSAEMQKELTRVMAEKEVIAERLVNLQQQLKDKLALHEGMQGSLQQLTVQLDEKQDLLYKAYQHQQQLKARRETLEELEADFSGFFQGVKEVLLARDRGELLGIEGAVAELVQVTGQYSQAIETALGAASQHIVTQNEQYAQQAINWLKQKRAGRATFLPKTVMKSRRLSDAQISAVSSHPAFVNMAYNLVTFDESNRSIVENLLGNVLVASHLEGASQMARLLGFKYRVVTLDGDIVNAGGSLTGGSVKQQTSLFTRKAELDTLSAKIAELEHSIQSAERTVTVEKEKVANLRQDLEEVRLLVEELRAQEQKHNTILFELDMQEKNLTTSVTLATSEQTSMVTRGQTLAEQKAQAEVRLAELATELTEINELVEQLTLAKAQGDTQKDVLRDEIGEKRSQLAVAQEQLSQVQIAIADMDLQMAKTNETIEKISQEIEWFHSDADANGPTMEEIEQAIIDWGAKRESLLTMITEKKEQKDELQRKLAAIEEDLKEKQRIHKSFMEAINTLSIKRSRLQYEQGNFIAQLKENYELDFEAAKELAEAIDDVAQVRRKVKLLKQSIEELGPVNLTAIDEFERVQERHAFLSEQRSDLLAAKETLHEAIKEMDAEMTARFSETFTNVKVQFKAVFRELFGGGQADLVLVDPDNLLETGIEIVAQPPGKKLQSLSLLSGGERALTAIALLFAILNTRPVPFCILDEVEAALDESNVIRYSQYLKKFSKETQFIVITHRKGTMEGADVLYGITMQESGVSKLVSVKLEEEEVPVGEGV
ncbi:chromosome segregation protein SMC [Lysinibacillus sp. KU-BSD001]|uniref:chromosome segregation protein SMC n=1 Tax=Lysinibacillus sp. KU-BSD001 TaxID=3141328 RepID=UPI0036F06C54